MPPRIPGDDIDGEEEVTLLEEDGGGEQDDAEEVERAPAEGEDADDEAGDEGDAEEVAAPRGRAEARIQTLRREAQENAERAARLERELAETRAASQRQQPQETEQQRAERLAMLTPEERMEVRLAEAEAKSAKQLQAMRFQMQDSNDKALFEAKAAADPLRKKMAVQVETELQSLRSQGQNIDRENLFIYLVGKQALEARGKKVPKQKLDGERRIRRETTRVTNGRGDVGASRPSGASGAAKRLENVEI